MKRFVLFVCVLVFACTAPLNSTLVSDGNLAIAGLKALSADAALLGAPSADTTAIGLATDSVQTALTDLQKGIKTPADFATLVNDQISQLAPTLLKDFHANNTITTGVVLLQQLLPLIAAEVSGPAVPTAAMSPKLGDARQQLQAWLNGQKK